MFTFDHKDNILFLLSGAIFLIKDHCLGTDNKVNSTCWNIEGGSDEKELNTFNSFMAKFKFFYFDNIVPINSAPVYRRNYPNLDTI